MLGRLRTSIRNNIHQTKVYIILTVYICAMIIQSFLPALPSNTLANTRYSNTNLVVLLVDKDLYADISLQSGIDRYAQRYIQGRLSDTRAIIFPLDTETIKARDITKMLENIYHDGLEGQPSTLRGVILIGDKVPLPIINDRNTFFPSIFPYTDFDDQKYYRDPQTTYFLPNSKPKAQAELRHGLITMGTTVSDYRHFFDKLKTYANNPAGYIGTGIWYDDFIDQKESFNSQFIPYYLNNFILAEDIAYHRFNPLMIDFFNQSHTNNINTLLTKQSALTGSVGSYQAQVGSFFDGLVDTLQNSGTTLQTHQTPTLFVDDGLQGFLKSYSELSSVGSRARMRDNILAAGRRSLDDLDTHSEKITINDRMYYSQIGDQTITPLLVEANKLLEDTLIKIVSDNHYALHVPLPTYGEVKYDRQYQLFTNNPGLRMFACDTDLANNTLGNSQNKKTKVYETFFYGTHANDITGLQQTSIFIGSPTRYTDSNSINTATGFSNYAGLGSSYTVFDQLVEANRGYNVSHAHDDNAILSDILSPTGIKRSLRCTTTGYNAGYRGNNTPLALTGGSNGALSLLDKNYHAVGTTRDTEGRQWLANKLNISDAVIDTFPGSLYDIAGSQLVLDYNSRMDRRNSLSSGGTILNTMRYKSILGQVFNFNDNDKVVLSPCAEDARDSLPISQRDFFDVMGGGISIDNLSLNSGYASDIQVTGPQGTGTQFNGVRCPAYSSGSIASGNLSIGGSGFYVRQSIQFKTIDSTIIHNSPNNNELSGLLLTTPSRPIDSVRYMTFKGVGGDRVKLIFPNLYAIPIYKTGSTTGSLVLKSVNEIAQSIREHLRTSIDNYNNDLTTQLNKRTLYFNTNPSAFALLSQANIFANPSRTYNLLDPDLFIDQISPQLINTIANLLYTTNSIIPEKIATETISENIAMLQQASDINHKKNHILTKYLHAPDSEHTIFNYPGYNSGGYELVALTSDGDDTIASSDANNSLLQSIKQRRTDHIEQQQIIRQNIENQGKDNVCAGPYGEPVPIFDLSTQQFPWFDALQCRADQFTLGSELTDFFWLDYKNAQGPVLIPNMLKPLLKDGGASLGGTPTTPWQEYVIPGGNGDTLINGNGANNTSLQKAIIESTDIEVKNPAYLLTSNTPLDMQPQLLVQGISNIGDIIIDIASTGDVCLIIDNKNTCNDARTGIINQSTTLALPLIPQDNKAGESTIIVTLCKSNNTNACAIQSYPVSVTAGEAQTINIDTPGDRFIIGTVVPLRLHASDMFDNTIDLSIPGYTITVSTGTIYGQTGYEIQRLDEILSYVGSASSNTEYNTRFSVYNRSGNLVTSKDISFVQGNIDFVALSGTASISGAANRFMYTLPASPTERYSDLSGEIQIIPTSLPGMTLRLADDNNRSIHGYVSIDTEQKILSPGIIQRQLITSGGSTSLTNIFSQTNTVLIDESGRINIYFMPTGKAGTETVTLTLPDGRTTSFTIDIVAGPATSLAFTPDIETTDDDQRIRLTLGDYRGNLVPTLTVVRVNTFGSLSLSGASQRTIVLSGGSDYLTLTQSAHKGKGSIIAQGINNDIIPAWREHPGQQSMIPWTGMNALYLSLIGSDRGNMLKEKNIGQIQTLFSTSPKLLAMTTQIADPRTLHPAIGKLNSSGSIVSLIDDTPLSATSYSDANIAYISGYNGGSSNSESITLVIDTSQSYTPQTITSIEESISPENNVGRRHDQSHLTQFGQGVSVGDATRHNASDMMINIGDPLIMRISDNTPLLPSDPDGLGKGPGQEILSSPEKTIRKTLHTDINNDALEDIVIVYNDGSVEWQKQYGGTKTFVPMGPLLHIFDTINDVFVADTAGDGFGDLIVQLSDETIRVYTNNEGIFSVDGFPLCLSGTKDPSNPSSLKGFDQWLIDDMDADGRSDIITNNKGEVQIVYGRQASNGHSYISQENKICDSSRLQRQGGNIQELTTFTTQIASGMQIIDDSLIHRAGLTEASQGSIDTTDALTAPDDQDDNTAISNDGSFFADLKDTAVTFFQNIFSSNNSNSTNINLSNADPSSLINSASNDILRRSVSPIDYIPVYEASTTQQENLRYIATSQSKPDDRVRVYKQFTDLNGETLKANDTVRVTVTIEGTNNNRMTYIDHIGGPWQISFDNNDRIRGWNAGTLNSDHQYVAVAPADGYTFIIDNISLGSANTVTFSYTLSYQGASVSTIHIEKTNNDIYPDIKIYPSDSCSKFYRVYENEASLLRNYRSYGSRFVDLQAKIDNYAGALQSNTQNFIGEIGNSIGDGVSSLVNSPNGGGSLSGIAHEIMQGIGGEKINFETLLGSLTQTLFQPQGASVNIQTNLLGSFDQKIQDAMKQGLEGLCNGFNTTGGGIPVPFNMAFLSPGTFNLFGCRVPAQGQLIPDIYPKDKGFPAFWFPGDGQVFGLPGVPLPYGSILAGVDEFGYFGFPAKSGVIPGGTQIRVYLSPTLTMQMGMAICFGPQKAGSTIPSPLKHMGGNCVVVKLPIDLLGGSNTGNNTNNLSDQDILDLSRFGACTNPIVKPHNSNNPNNISGSPFQLVNTHNGVTNNPFPPGTYAGIVNLERSPIIEEEQYTRDDGDILRGGQKVTPKIVGGLPASRGIAQCIVNDWMDRQVNYMINNLTNMQIGIYLPDVTDLGKGFDTLGEQLGTGAWKEDFREVGQSFVTDNQANEADLTGGGRLARGIHNSSAFLRKITPNQSALDSLSDGLNNPFDQVAKLFENTPLIQINSRDIQIKVPMIYEEDIARYTSYLQTRGQRNQTIIQDRESLFQATFGICGRHMKIQQGSGGITVVNDHGTMPAILDAGFFDTMKKNIQSNKAELLQSLEEVEKCIQEQTDNSPISESCKKRENVDKDMKKVKNIINQQQELQNTCYSFLFKDTIINPSLNSFLSIQHNGQALITDVKENIKVLDQYKRFPLQLYQRVHVTDRYLAETVATVESFLGYINTWLNTNASRFEQYVDAILTMSLALETRQAIIDLSVNRQKKCSTCTVDNYDFYACSLGFLCPALKPPLLRLPPLKIPSIYMDLSHIDARMEILLPKFRFSPTTINLPSIPDLPQPPQFSITTNANQNTIDLSLQLAKEIRLIQNMADAMSINIPDTLPVIPIMPAPPTLPELPSFVPTLNLNLPYLPPAPKIPSLSPEFQTILDVSSFIVDLFCIVKNNIGLVGESGVKTRIEQLTQRTYEIPLFDNINITRDASYQQDKLEGFDFKLDAYVNFTYNFSMIYDLIQSFADISNNTIEGFGNRTIESQNINTISDEINNQTQQNFNLNTSDLFSMNSNRDTANASDTGVSIDTEKGNLSKVLAHLIDSSNTPQGDKLGLENIAQRLSQKSRFTAQTVAIEKIRGHSTEIINTQRKEIQKLADTILDYDKLVASIQRDDVMLVSDTAIETTFTTALLSGDTRSFVSTKPLLHSYIDVQSSLLDKYAQSLDNPNVIAADTNNSISKIKNDIAYLSSGMTMIRHFSGAGSLQDLVQKQSNNTISNTRQYRAAASSCQAPNEESDVQGIMYNEQGTIQNPTSSINYYPSSSLSAQVGGPSISNNNLASIDMMQSINYSDYVQGLTLPFRSGTGQIYLDVVGSAYFAEVNKGLSRYDINSDTSEDILLWSDKKVWIKRGGQEATNTINTTNFFTDLTVAPVRTESKDRDSEANSQGYVDIDGINIRLSSTDWSVKNIAVQGQSYDSFSISWTNSLRQNPLISGYLIEIQTIPDFYHLKAYDDVPDALESRYVLLLPDGEGTGGKIMVPDSLNANDISDYMTGRIIDTAYYNPTNATLSYGFEDLPRAWYYLRIASLTDQGSTNTPLYTPSSAWSNHVVAGQQIIADDTGPEANVSLRRVRTNTIDDQGLALEGVVNTKYDIVISRNDPSGVRDNWIENGSGQVIRISTGSLNTIKDIFAEENTEQAYIIVARDFDDNITREKLMLTLHTPDITIDAIRNLGSGQRIIESSIDTAMDQGLIRFQKFINNRWQIFTPSQPSLSLPNITLSPLQTLLSGYLLDLNQTVVTGGVYSTSDTVVLYDSDGTSIGSINRSDGEIQIDPAYKDHIQIRPSFTSNKPLINIIDTQKNLRLFTIAPFHRNTTIQSSNTTMQVISLTESNYGQFAGGQCLLDLMTKQCIISSDTHGTWVINHPYQDTVTALYRYDSVYKKALYTIIIPGQGTIATIASTTSLQ